MDAFSEQAIVSRPPRTLRREIVVALTIKLVLLFGLWLLIFRSGSDTPRTSADIAGRLFATPPTTTPLPDRQGSRQFDPSSLRPLTQEVPHVQ